MVKKNSADTLLAADSFLVRASDGVPKVLALEKHLQRFSAHTLFMAAENEFEKGQVQELLTRFVVMVKEDLAAVRHDSFPRLEFIRDETDFYFELKLRESPELKSTLDITDSLVENQAHAAIKGPNIDLYAQANRAAGGEVMRLMHGTKTVLETTTTALVWWHEGRLHRAPKGYDSSRVASITESEVLEIAAELNILVCEEEVTPIKLQQREVWALNSLHGIRRVKNLLGAELPTENARLLREFQNLLAKRFQRVG